MFHIQTVACQVELTKIRHLFRKGKKHLHTHNTLPINIEMMLGGYFALITVPIFTHVGEDEQPTQMGDNTPIENMEPPI